jgi:hypothetical protein
MTAPFFLIVPFISSSGGAAMTSTPMESMGICEFAAAQVQKLEGALSNIRTQCVRGEE